MGLGVSQTAPSNQAQDNLWLDILGSFLEKTGGDFAPIPPEAGSSSSSDSLLTPPTPQSSTMANEVNMDAFFNFDGDLTALPDHPLPTLQDNYYQPEAQCANDFATAHHPFLEHISPAQLMRSAPTPALSPLEHFSMSTFAQPSAVTPSPSSTVPPSSVPPTVSSSSVASSSSGQSYYRPPPGAINASSRRVAGSWRAPLTFTTTITEDQVPIEMMRLAYPDPLPWTAGSQ